MAQDEVDTRGRDLSETWRRTGPAQGHGDRAAMSAERTATCRGARSSNQQMLLENGKTILFLYVNQSINQPNLSNVPSNICIKSLN